MTPQVALFHKEKQITTLLDDAVAFIHIITAIDYLIYVLS